MMRWPSAYCAMSSGISRSIMRSSTQPTRPELVRTRYQSSMMGFGGGAWSDGCAPVVAGLAETELELELSCFTGGAVLDEAGLFAGLADFFGLAFVFDCVAATGFGGLGAFFSAVAR